MSARAMRLLGVAVPLLAAAGARARAGEAPAPRQPVHFSHRVHAGEQRMGCSACHPYAARAAVAGIPSLARCRGCHKFVKQDPDRPRLDEAMKELVARLQEDPPTPIAWVRVHRLPDHVYFTHERHVRAGLACRACHGEVEEMEEVRQVSSLLMGWCLDCHERARAERPLQRARLTECVTCHK